jgi:aspartate carbamoyltransferase catalytic subunit
MRSLLNIFDLTKDEIFQIFDLAEYYVKHGIKNSLNKLVFSLFFEPSTRTEASFCVAAKKLGCITDKINIQNLSTKKGEDIKDLILTFNQMKPDLMIIRHFESGILQVLKNYCDCGIVNAGDGINQHPTQSLIDAFTLLCVKEDIKDLEVLICGDVINSRVAHSDIQIFKMLGCNVKVFCHPTVTQDEMLPGVKLCNNFEEAICNCDAVIMLRMQKERHKTRLICQEEYKNLFCLDQKKLKFAKDSIVIMHPGPVNRGIEICPDVLEQKNCLVLKQVMYGVYIRAAVISFLLDS